MSWLPKKTVVVPVDFSEASLRAVDSALALVADASHLHVIHVLPAMEPGEPGLIWTTIDDATRKRHTEQALKERLDDAKFANVHMSVAVGDPGHEITEFAGREKADLIVLPSHGRTGLSRILIGSVAERVVRLAKCPVLVLKN